jgi:hypothetical protein
LKSRIVDVAEVQRALNRAARNAMRGSADVRAGRVLIGRNKAGGQFGTARAKAPARATRGKK